MIVKKVVKLERFDCFNDGNEICVEKFYNFKPNKILNNSKGVKNATFPTNYEDKTEQPLNISATGLKTIQGIAFFKQYFPKMKATAHRLLVYGDNKKVYINQMLDDTFDLFWIYNLEFDSAPMTLAFKKNDEDAVILASNERMMLWDINYSPYTIENAPIITSMCMNNEVLFCTIKEPSFKIWYATDLDAENVGYTSNTSGYISLEDDLGNARKIIAFNEDVYVFRDYGISKINYVKKAITVSQVYASNTKIYTNTVAICGNSILFMTKDGIYSFNGVKVTKIEASIANNMTFENSGAVASSMGERYYLALRLDFEDQEKVLCENEDCINNAIVILNTTDFSYEIIRGVDVKNFLPVKTDVFEKVLVIFNSVHKDKIGEICEMSKCINDNLPKLWTSKSLVNNLNVKLFTKLSVNAEEGVKFKLIYDDKEMSFTTYKSGVNEFMFKICCKDVKLEISSTNDSAVVKNAYLEYYEY